MRYSTQCSVSCECACVHSAYKPVHGHVTTAPDTVQLRSNPRPYWEESNDLQTYDVHVTKEATSSSSGASITNNDQVMVGGDVIVMMLPNLLSPTLIYYS